MTLYTVMPMEQVWEGIFSNYAATREVMVQGMLMQVEPMEEGRAKIVRLLDCPLDRYLDSSFSPGSIISLT